MSEQEIAEHAGDRAEVSVEIDADPTRVWESLTGDDVEAWFGEGSFVGPEPGDSLYVEDPVTGKPKSGIVERVDYAPTDTRSIEYTWWPIGDPDDASHVTIKVEPASGGSRVTVIERPLVTGSEVRASVAPRALARC